MPTDVLLSIEEQRLDLRAYLLLIPLIVCLGSIILTVESPSFAAAVIALWSE